MDLTEEGEKMYNRIIFLRPKYVGRITTNNKAFPVRLVFDCSVRQIKYYFVRLGANAMPADQRTVTNAEEIEQDNIPKRNKNIKIADHTELRNYFKDFYHKAYDLYSKN